MFINIPHLLQILLLLVHLPFSYFCNTYTYKHNYHTYIGKALRIQNLPKTLVHLDHHFRCDRTQYKAIFYSMRFFYSIHKGHKNRFLKKFLNLLWIWNLSFCRIRVKSFLFKCKTCLHALLGTLVAVPNSL